MKNERTGKQSNIAKRRQKLLKSEKIEVAGGSNLRFPFGRVWWWWVGGWGNSEDAEFYGVSGDIGQEKEKAVRIYRKQSGVMNLLS